MSIDADDEFRGPARARRPRAALFLKIGLSLLLTYVCFRSAFSVAKLTYISMGESALILVLSGSLAYFGVLLAVGKWVSRAITVTSRTAYWNGGLTYLPLAISAMFIKIFMGHTGIESSVYPIRILLIVLLLSDLFRYKELLSDLFLELWNRDVSSAPVNSTHVNLNPASAMNVRQIAFLAASYVLSGVLWTWLVIQYRYFSLSFISQSSWIMANLWIFVAFGWAGCIAIFFFIRQQIKRKQDVSKVQSSG